LAKLNLMKQCSAESVFTRQLNAVVVAIERHVSHNLSASTLFSSVLTKLWRFVFTCV
jgi:hypothetical protein